MTQEEKDLLLKDLCSRLPYKVKCDIGDSKSYTLSSVRNDYCDGILIGFEEQKNGFNMEVYLSEVKPYLFPLSSMTEEQKEELYIVTNGKFNANYKYIDNCKPRNWSEWGTTEYNWIRHYDIDLLHTWLNKNHFDYRDLIPMGLANDATGLNIY